MKFDWTISVGTIIHAIIIVSTLLGLYVNLRVWMRGVDLQLKAIPRLEEKVDTIGEVVPVLVTKVESLWEWFTTRLERRNNG